MTTEMTWDPNDGDEELVIGITDEELEDLLGLIALVQDRSAWPTHIMPLVARLRSTQIQLAEAVGLAEEARVVADDLAATLVTISKGEVWGSEVECRVGAADVLAAHRGDWPELPEVPPILGGAREDMSS